MQNIKTITPLAISGVARAGKDTLCNLIEEIFKEKGYKVLRLSFAGAVKKDVDKLCKKMFGISAYTEDTLEKHIIRPMVRGYGTSWRNFSRGTHWIDILRPKIERALQQKNVIPVITDLRFAEFESGDELSVLKKDYNSFVVHVSRIQKNGDILPPANEDERENDPIIKEEANHTFSWETESEISDLRKYAEKVVDEYIKYVKQL